MKLNQFSILFFGFLPLVSANFYYLALFKCHEYYKLHGLWAQYDKTHYPEYCKTFKLNKTQIKPFEKEIEMYWGCGNPELYIHELKKHYTCMFDKNMTQGEYINKTLALYKETKKDFKKLCKENNCLIPFDLNFKRLLRFKILTSKESKTQEKF